jgi:hypothetical protein
MPPACEGCEAVPAGAVAGAVVVAAGGVCGADTPEAASHPQGSVMVTGTGVNSALQTVHDLTVAVNPGGMSVECVAQDGVASVQISVMVYVAGTRPVGHND